MNSKNQKSLNKSISVNSQDEKSIHNENVLISLNKNHIRKSQNFTKKLYDNQNQEDIAKMLNDNSKNIKSLSQISSLNLNKFEEEKIKLSELEKERNILTQDVELQNLFFKRISDENHDYRQIKENLEKILKEELTKKHELLEERKVFKNLC